MKPVYQIRSAKPGEPSILWVGKSGRKYRNIVDSKTDKAENAYEQAAESNTLLYSTIALLVVLLVVYKLLK